MDKMTVTSIILVSFPEMLLILITTLMIAGYKDVFNFKDKKNIWKLSASVLLMLFASVFPRAILPVVTYNFILMLILYPLIITLVYRSRIMPTILGTLLSLAIIVIGESTLFSMSLKLFNLSLQQVYSDDFIRFVITLPIRLLQVIVIVVISKYKKINFITAKLNIDEWIQIMLYALMTISSMLSIEKGLKNIQKDYFTITSLIVNVLIAVIFSTWTIITIFKKRKKTLIDKKIHDFELMRIRQLLSKGYTEHVVKLIDATIEERGKRHEI